ncbi:MAG: DUF1194 domain-containing protein [Methyloligellaceae bacterium]
MPCNVLKVVLAAVIVMLPYRPTDANKTQCALALVLAIDVSGSIEADEYALQMLGLADALRSRDIVGAIESLGGGGIYATVLHWSGNGQQIQVLPWTQLANQEALQVFAAKVERLPRTFDHYATAIGEALGFANRLFSKVPAQCARRVIDVSGDGRSNEGWSPHLIRDAVVLGGVTINGLAILANDPKLKSYYREQIIGGSGAFVMSADRIEDYPDAIRRKLLREISPGPIAINEGFPTKSKRRIE